MLSDAAAGADFDQQQRQPIPDTPVGQHKLHSAAPMSSVSQLPDAWSSSHIPQSRYVPDKGYSRIKEEDHEDSLWYHLYERNTAFVQQPHDQAPAHEFVAQGNPVGAWPNIPSDSTGHVLYHPGDFPSARNPHPPPTTFPFDVGRQRQLGHFDQPSNEPSWQYNHAAPDSQADFVLNENTLNSSPHWHHSAVEAYDESISSARQTPPPGGAVVYPLFSSPLASARREHIARSPTIALDNEAQSTSPGTNRRLSWGHPPLDSSQDTLYKAASGNSEGNSQTHQGVDLAWISRPPSPAVLRKKQAKSRELREPREPRERSKKRNRESRNSHLDSGLLLAEFSREVPTGPSTFGRNTFCKNLVQRTPLTLANDNDMSPRISSSKQYNGRLSLERLSQLVVSYLRDPSHECTILLSQSTAVQKSYGDEKRFFTPPICRLMGGGWDLPELSEQRYMNLLPAKSEYPVHPDFLKITLSTSKVSMGLNDMDQEEQDRLRVSGKVLLKRERVDLISRTSSLSVGPDDHGVDKLIALATFEKLHLNTIESRKEVPLFFQVQTPSGSFQYESRPFIKISKPSKKKQTRKSPLLINSGSQIALFNRTKAQTANTRYLTYSPSAKALASCSTFWETWTIYSADDPDFDPSVNSDAGNTHTSFDIPHDPKTDVFFDTPGNKHHVAPCKSKERRGKRIATPPADPLNTGGFYNYPVPVHYGDVVVLQHTLSGVVTCPLIVRKIERRTEAVISSDPTKRNGLPFIQSDPLSPLHKVAFQKADEPGQYLALSDTLEGSRIQVHHTALSRYYRQYRAKDTGVKFFPRTNIPVGQDVPLTFVSGSAATEPRPPDTSKGTSDDVGESSIWTVVGVDHVESTFHMPRLNSHELTLLQIEPNQQMQAVDPSTPPRDGPPQPMVPPHLNIQHANPVPRLTSVFYRDQHSVSLYGTHLADSKLMAFFGPYPSPHTRVANVPNSSELALIADVPATWRTPKADLVVSHSENACSNSSTVPLLLVRDDGVIFRTGFYFCSQCS